MICPRCGERMEQGQQFCSRCGYQTERSAISGAGRRPGYGKTKPAANRIWIAGLLLGILSLGAILVLILIAPETGILNTAGEDGASFSNELLSGFVFDDAQETETTEEAEAAPAVSNMTPSSGTVGTKIAIEGSGLASAGIQSVMLGDTEMNIYSISDERIEVYLPYGAQSGSISLLFAGQTLDAGAFEVVPQQKELLAEQQIGPSADAQTVASDRISVTIPGGALEQAQTVRIESIADPQPINLPERISGTAFSITVGNVHEFEEIVLIDFELPADLPGEPSAAYFNETTSLWDTLPSEVVDGKLCIYTDHLTDLLVFYWGSAIYSPDGYFKIFYEADDTFSCPGIGSMDAMAKQVGVILEEARKDYEAKIPEGYREDFSYLGVKDSMDVYLDSGYKKGTYNAFTNNILLPTTYTDTTDFETMPAHEFFHSYQDTVWNEFKAVGKMGRSQNKWAVEAIAELAAYELAFPEKNRERNIKNASVSQSPYDTFDEAHEYDMSCFLRYLLRETNSTFEDMWVSIVDNAKLDLGVCLNDFFKSKSADFVSLEMAYLDFWKDVIGDTEAPTHNTIENIFDKELVFNPDRHTSVFNYQTKKASTAEYNLFTVKKYSDNMPVRIFSVECTGERAMCTQVEGILYANALNTARVSGGHDWDYIYADTSTGKNHALYTFEKGKDSAVLVGLEASLPDTVYSVKVSEIQAQCKPQKLENVRPGQQLKLEVAFKDIFAYVGQVEVVVDFGDGTVQRYAKANDTGIFSGWITHTFGTEITGEAVTFSMYDASGGELIAKLVIPMTTDKTMTLSASPSPAQAGETVQLSTNLTDAGYTYRWDFGDGKTATTYGTQTSHVYGTPGAYTVVLTVIDLDGTQYGVAKQTITVYEPQTATPSASSTAFPSSSPTATSTASDTLERLNQLELTVCGTWRVLLPYKYDDTHNYCNTLQFYDDGTFESHLSAVTIETYETTNHAYDIYHIASEFLLPSDTEYVFAWYVSEFGSASGTYTYDAESNYGEVAYTARYKDTEGNIQEFTDTELISFNLVTYYEYGIADPNVCPLLYKNGQYVNAEWTGEESIDAPGLCGSWELASDMYFDEYEEQYWYSLETLQFNADGTCVYKYENVFVNLPRSEDYVAGIMGSEESLSGEYAAQYASEEAVAQGKPDVYGLIVFRGTGYLHRTSFWYDGDVLYYENSVYTRG